MSFALILSGGSICLAQDDVGEDSEDDVIMLEELTVTGSRIERSDLTSVSPLSVFTETDILETGHVTMEDFVQNLPSVTGGFLGDTVNNGSDGFATASMRGLGDTRTLVLLNGQRLPSVQASWASGLVDLNMIPAGMVERVEVLRDGASTIYGSDAIAGVINIITKRNFEGAQFQTQYDITGEGDGAIFQASGIVGANTDSERGNVVFGVDYTKRNEIMQGDRDFSACPYYDDGSSLICGGSDFSYPAQFFNDNYDGNVLINGEIVPFTYDQYGFNYAKWSYMVTPQEVLSTYANGRYDLVQESAIGSVTAIGESVWTNRQSDQLMAAVGTFWIPLVPATNPGNPTGEDVYVARRLFETGGRHFTQDASSWRLVFGLEGELNNGWNWDVTYNYGSYLDTQLEFGQINQPRAETSLDPDLCAADPECPGVWDPFSTDTLNEDLQNYILVDHSPVGKSQMNTLQFNLAGDLGDFELPAGQVQWAVGYEHRREEALWQPDGAATLGMIYFVSADKTEGKYSVDELYGEVRVPILEDKPFADVLAAEISVRRSDYSLLNNANTNFKYGLEWGPIPSLRFRTVYSEGFRMANIQELYGAQYQSAQNYNDPCINYGTNANATVAANCLADGLPSDFQVGSSQATTVYGGNPDLKPEESESLTLGVVVVPEQLPRLEVSLDYYDIKINNAIGTAGVDDIINGCYNSPGFESFWCDMIYGPTHPIVNAAPHATSPYRDATGSISGVIGAGGNLADYETEGIDFSVNYVWEFGNSNLNTGVMGTYLMKYNYLAYEGADVMEMAGYFGEDPASGISATFPEWRLNFNFRYAMDNWSFTWAPRYFGSTDDIAGDEANLSNTAKAIWYHDVQATYDYEGWGFTLGIRNLLDEDPPYVSGYDDMNTINASYDTAGRYFYARASYSF